LRRVGDVLVAVLALVVAVVLAGISSRINQAEPVVDAFYDTPDEVPGDAGALLRSEPFTREIPDGARAWRILYTTTVADGVPAVASGIVVIPDPGPSEPPPMIAWAHGTTGAARRCAPSLLPNPWTAGALFSLDRVIEEGWALVATDYVGLGTEGQHAYLVGEPAGRSVLDGVRAARQLDGVEVSDRTVVWGHSQGGGAALWTGVLAPSYAPDASVIGVAALAPASDLVGLMDTLPDVTGGSIFAAYAARGYSSFYDDVAVGDYVRPTARTTFESIADRCLNAAAIVSALSAVTVGMEMFKGDVTSGPLARRLDENVPRAAIEAPLLLGQGEDDSLVRADVQAAYVADRCAEGYPVDYRTYAGRGHVPLVEADSPLIPELIEWTHDRLDGAEPSSTC
jgi:dipeptidyl aminopeptidase/acylaminoacyl peptidase